ncbi:SatD family protein [Opitutae bacterium]|nr:SatD family protein [Opitutae bacterium]
MVSSPLYPVVIFRALASSKSREASTEMGHLSEILSNPHISKSLLSPYSRNQDGYFQGIFASGDHLLQNLFLIREQLYPLDIQFSIGIGEIQTPINSVMATEIEGKSIEHANLGLSLAPKTGNYLIMRGFSKTLELLMNPSMELLWSSTRNWNQNRIKILNYILLGYSEKKISQILEISERAIYKNIAEAKLGHWKDLILAVEENISRVLKSYQ